MGFLTFQIVWLVGSYLIAGGSPVAMLQHATSSQSIVFHPQSSLPSSSIPGSAGAADQYGANPPNYDYKYEVSDHQTGDRKSHWESRDGDRVRGAYSLYEPDGALRTVEYTADAIHGFNAVVRRDEPKLSSHGSHNQLSNSVSDGYESSARQSRYPSGRGSSGYGAQSQGSSGFGPGVGYRVNHVVAPRVEPVKPY